MPASVKTPDWKLRSFSWLPLDRWTPANLFNMQSYNGKNYCKVCDTYISVSQHDDHVAFHVEEEKERVEKVKAAAAAAREAEKELLREENEANKPAKTPRNIARNGGRPRVDRSGVPNTIFEALSNSSGLTLAQIADSTGVALHVVRAQIKNVSGLVQLGTQKSGGRGKPPIIYGVKS